jgi:hypothetical protein
VKTFESLDLTPEFAYLLNLESDYLITANATQVTRVKATPNNPHPSAFGPWHRVRMSSSAEIMTTFFVCRMGRIVYASV